MQFLRGLNDQYHNIKSHVLLMEPILPIMKIFSLVVQQERQLANNIPVFNINSVNSSHISTFVICTFFVEKMVIQRMFVFFKVDFSNQEISKLITI